MHSRRGTAALLGTFLLAITTSPNRAGEMVLGPGGEGLVLPPLAAPVVVPACVPCRPPSKRPHRLWPFSNHCPVCIRIDRDCKKPCPVCRLPSGYYPTHWRYLPSEADLPPIQAASMVPPAPVQALPPPSGKKGGHSAKKENGPAPLPSGEERGQAGGGPVRRPAAIFFNSPVLPSAKDQFGPGFTGPPVAPGR